MDKFSDRLGITQPKELLQLEGMDEALRNSLWNVFSMFCLKDATFQ